MTIQTWKPFTEFAKVYCGHTRLGEVVSWCRPIRSRRHISTDSPANHRRRSPDSTPSRQPTTIPPPQAAANELSWSSTSWVVCRPSPLPRRHLQHRHIFPRSFTEFLLTAVIFSMRQHICLARYMLSPVRQSVCQTVVS